MDFRMTEEQELLLDGLRELMERECSEDYIKQCDAEGRPPVEFYKALVDNGYGLLGCPESVGGTPVDNLTLMLVKEEICRLGGPIHALTSMFHVDMMKEFGTEEQLEKCMAEINEGRMPFCSGFSEPQAGSDSHAILTSYVRREDGKYRDKRPQDLHQHGRPLAYMACLARDFTREGEYFTMFFVPMDAPGVKTAPLHKIGWNMNPTYKVYLENVVVEEKDIIGKEGEAFKQLMRNFEMERLMMAVAILGMAECAYQDAAKYANQRVQFGKPIGTRQLIQEKIVNMKIKIMNMKNLCYQCAWEKDQGICHQERLRPLQALLRPGRQRGHRRRPADHGRHRLHPGLPHLPAVARRAQLPHRRRHRRDHDTHSRTRPAQGNRLKRRRHVT